jgi:hypothetical protein
MVVAVKTSNVTIFLLHVKVDLFQVFLDHLLISTARIAGLYAPNSLG